MAAEAPDTGFLGAHCLVTGGAGFIGSNLSLALLDEGSRIVTTDLNLVDR